jgi:hypothetical protein
VKIVEVPGTVVVPTVLVEGIVVVVKAVVSVVTVGLKNVDVISVVTGTVTVGLLLVEVRKAVATYLVLVANTSVKKLVWVVK